MPSLDVKGVDGGSAGTIDLPGSVFGASVDRSLLHDAVVMQRASIRQGTSSTRGRGEVAGSGKKPWKQKHTGRARAGSVRSPIWRHGGVVFGPKPRSYAYRLPKKMYRLALRSALSSKVESGDVVVLSELTIPEQKTRHLYKLLSGLGLTKSVLLIVGDGYDTLVRAARNIPGVKLARVEHLNVYDVLRYEKLALLKSEIEKVQEYWS